MKFEWVNDLPFISIRLIVAGATIELEHALIDTGAASSLFNIDKIFENGMTIEENDTICKMVGIGSDILRAMRAVIDFDVDTITTKNKTED